MAKTKYSITLAYRKAIAQADKLEKIAGKIDRQREKVLNQKSQLSGYWMGKNSKCFCAKMADRENELARIASDLRKISSTIRAVAANTYKADMRAVELVQKKGGGGAGGGGGRNW